jgi:hypothetical protein
MRPWQTITVLILALAVGSYFLLRIDKPDPRMEKFVDCYIELALLHQRGDTAATVYAAQKDSVLNRHGFTEQTLRELKAQLDRDPMVLADIWEKIDKKLKARKEATEVKP